MKKILIAEDEKPLARVLALKLNSAGYETVTAFDGEEALSEIKKGQFDLVILDLLMPKKDGFYVLSEMTKLGSKTPVVVASNLGQQEDIDKAKKLGAVDYFIKSDVTLTQIIDKVKHHLA